MNVLLDTQILIWYLDGNPKITAQIRRVITEASSVYISSISIFEANIKKMIGKLHAPADLSLIIIDKGFVLLDVKAEHAEAVTQFPQLARHDPFDRLLLAQAHCDNLTLITTDAVLNKLGLPYVLDARKK